MQKDPPGVAPAAHPWTRHAAHGLSAPLEGWAIDPNAKLPGEEDQAGHILAAQLGGSGLVRSSLNRTGLLRSRLGHPDACTGPEPLAARLTRPRPNVAGPAETTKKPSKRAQLHDSTRVNANARLNVLL